MYVKTPECLETLACVVLLAALVQAIVERRARRYAEATGEKLPIPGERTSTRPTARIILDSLEPIIVVVTPDDTQTLAKSLLFSHKTLEALAIFPSVCLCAPQGNSGPWNPRSRAGNGGKDGFYQPIITLRRAIASPYHRRQC